MIDFDKKYIFDLKTPLKSFLNLNKDEYLLTSNKVLIWFLRISVFIIYVYFGIWKVFGLSPAEQLVTELHKVTPVSVIPISIFLAVLGIAEVLIGFLLLTTKGFTLKITLVMFTVHMFTTFMTLVLLPNVAFVPFPIPSIEAQYVIKNLVLIGSVLSICQLEKNQRILQSLTK